MAELNGAGIAAVLAADAAVQLGAGCLSGCNSHLHKAAYAYGVKLLERVGLEDLGVVIGLKELAGVVAAEAVGHLGEVVRAEAEELRLLGDIARRESGARDLYHRADLVFHLYAGCCDLRVCGFNNDILNILKLLGVAGKRDHNLRSDCDAELF